MEPTTHEYDEVNEIQYNIHNDTKIDEAINELSDEQLVVLRQDCLAGINRQKGILARIERRLPQN
jgi:hypothetical protein